MPQTNIRYFPVVGSGVMDRLRSWTKTSMINIHARVAPLALTPSPVQVSDVPIRDWDVLFNAVKARLRATVDEQVDIAMEPHDRLEKIRIGVLECAMALDQLHATLNHEITLRQQLEMDIVDAKTALNQIRTDLAGTQAGERHARFLSLHDSLTSLPNRRFFHERLDQTLSHAEAQHRTFALLYLDLDGFKQINDAHGHDVGDELLRIIAARLIRTLRTEDLVGRLGGDEFACLLADFSDREQLSRLAGKLFDAVSSPVTMGQLQLSVRPSIGIALCPANGTSANALLKNADTAMYQAKRDQTGHAYFDKAAFEGGSEGALRN